MRGLCVLCKFMRAAAAASIFMIYNRFDKLLQYPRVAFNFQHIRVSNNFIAFACAMRVYLE